MTRQEEIYNALKEYNIGWFNEDSPSIDNDTYNGDDLQSAFIKGVKWADSHPKFHWVSVKDNLPNDDINLYLTYCEVYTKKDNIIKEKHIELYLAYYDKKCLSWNIAECITNHYFINVLYWMPIPELPKE